MPYSEALKRAVYKYRYKDEDIHNKIKLKSREYTKKYRLKQSIYISQVKLLCNIIID